jgi:GntR family transcriptional repressor for pyruvate dehydrogenase complex
MTGLTSKCTGTVSRDGVASWIEEEILRGRLPVGGKLPPERELAARFGVSRPIVREALRGLAARGLIEIAPGRGAFARPVQAGDAARPLDTLYRRQNTTPREVVEARMMLEREAAVLAARRATPEELAAMQGVLARFDAAVGLIEKARWDVTFHALLAKMAHNQVIETMFHSIVSLTFELMLRSLGDPTVSRAGVPYHAQILAALRDGDAARARQAVEDHLLVAGRLYGSDLDQNLDLMARRELERFVGPSVSLESILDTVATEVARVERGVSAVEEDAQ